MDRGTPVARRPDGAPALQGARSHVPLASGMPPGLAAAQMLSVQRAAGNRAAQRLLPPPVTVQRKGPSLSALKRAAGIGKKQSSPAAKAERAAVESRSAKVVTVADLEKQVSTLEAATTKLIRAHQSGDGAGHRAALEVQRAADRIRQNLPDQGSKASKVLGRTYPEQVRRLRWISDETQLILDEVRVENTRREAQNIYTEAGRTATKGQTGALRNLTARSIFDEPGAAPPPNAKVVAYLAEHGFRSYEEAWEHAAEDQRSNPKSTAESSLRTLQPDLFTFTERARSRATARSMGLSAAELRAIQVYSIQDYRYINPATANDAGWMKANFPDLADKDDKSLEEWAELQDQLAAAGQNLDQRLADRRGQLTSLREEGGLHTGMALQGLRKMPVWKGTAYRGESIDEKRFYARFVKQGGTFSPRNPRFTWKTITSISKELSVANGFAYSGGGMYRVIYHFEITDGRDIEGMSLNRKEREVALLPGAEFEYGPIEVVNPGRISLDGFHVPWSLRMNVRQTR